MPPSQLKQLKASLRENGLVGPQKSKKQKKVAAKDGGKRLQRNAALENIRERFNPFEVKAPARREKFEVASNKVKKYAPGRPGVTKGLGEERRRETLLKEIQNRNKVGGILDRRFGENDPTMTPEERAAERFAKQTERKMKKSSMFNLEDDEEEMALTHMGRSLDFEVEKEKDDFEENDIPESDASSADLISDDIDDRPTKRIRLSEDGKLGDMADSADQLSERKKSKQEVMKEVMAKSKLYKYERQQAKEDDDDLRAELDKGLPELQAAMRGYKAPPKPLLTPPSTDSEPTMNPDRAAMLAGKDRKAAEKEYNMMYRLMEMDAKAKPSSRTKTEEEKAAEDAARLKELETDRLRRMKGKVEFSDDEPEKVIDEEEDDEQDDAELFGIAQPNLVAERRELDVEDEDEFVYDKDLIASDSEAEMASELGSEESDRENHKFEDDGDDDLINGMVLPKASNTALIVPNGNLAYTYPCPQTHKELLSVLKGTMASDLPTIVQRIRALYHPRLAEGNKDKLAKFAIALTRHVAYLADQKTPPNFAVVESLIRHLQSMAKTQSEPVCFAYRSRLRKIAEDRPLKLSPGDLIILTGVSTTFPTSDHFHSVGTPAMLTIARYLGQSTVQNYHDLITGAYCCTLALRYQTLSKRYIPEFITYVTNALAILAPLPLPAGIAASSECVTPSRLPTTPLRTQRREGNLQNVITFRDLYSANLDHDLMASILLRTFVRLLYEAAQLWQSKTAFNEILSHPVLVLKHVLSESCIQFLNNHDRTIFSKSFDAIIALQHSSVAARKPLLLHNHRALAIKTSIPKFEEGFNPDRHYDPDRDRSELNKLKAEHKRERKGAMRELRKDANFIARESLREKKEKDAAYEKKFKRLVAEIQGEEGHESKAYEREKAKRKGKW